MKPWAYKGVKQKASNAKVTFLHLMPSILSLEMI